MQVRSRSGARMLLGAALLVAVATPSRALPDYVLEVRSETSTLPFQRYVYACTQCTLAEFAAVVPPAGYVKGDAKVALPSDIVATLPTAPPGVPPSLDLVPGIPGDDFVLVAEILGATVLGVGFDPVTSTGLFLAVAQVQRDTTFTYDAGQVVHVVTDDSGDDYLLFSFNVGRPEDLSQVGALSMLPLPVGWSYRSFLLSEPFEASSGGVADVYSTGTLASWQRVTGLPASEPGSSAFVGAAFSVWLGRRRAARARKA